MKLISQIRKKLGVTNTHSFDDGKTLIKIEWWISSDSAYPDLYWARLRVFSDGSADAAFEPTKIYGFDNREFASYFLSEDEFMPFDTLDEEDEDDIGIKKSDIAHPSWSADGDVDFEYLGTY
jgi:hypothetical protein